MAAILVVEDEFGIAEVLESALVDARHEVVIAINGRQGLERLAERPLQLVLLDFMMPVLDGPGMLRVMRADPHYRDIPVIVMSSLPEAAVAEVAQLLSSSGHRVHASLSGDAQTTTLSLSGATLTREAGNQLLGNRRLRETLKAAGVRIVVMVNGQESWTYML